MVTRKSVVIAILFVGATVAAVVAMQLPRFRPSPEAPIASAPGEDAPDTPRAEVTLDTRRQQLIGVRTVEATHVLLAPEIRASGNVTYDETRQVEINTRVDGWIRELQADYTGRTIRKGEPLFTLYSPDLIATQNEYLLALRGQSSGNADAGSNVQKYADRLVEAARERLLRLDMSAEDIDRLGETGRSVETITFRSPVSGIIVEKPAVKGMRVMAGQPLFKVADLATVWVEADVYERDLASVRVGMRATVSVPAYPDRQFTGRVSYIGQLVEPQTRTVRTRIALANSGGLLKPNMLATVLLHAPESHVLAVPADAVVDTGTQHLVFVAEGDGRFSPREVQVGRRSGGHVEIASGLEHGELVAESATFFLDSESQLQGALKGYTASTAAEQSVGPATTTGLAVTFGSDPDPARVGDVTLIVTVKDANGKPVTDAEVSVVLYMAPMPSMNMPAWRSEATLRAAGAGVYRGTGNVMTSGPWEVTVRVTRDGQTLATQQFGLVARS